MSQANYTTKPDWVADGAKSRTGYAAANIFASRHGWIAPIAGMGHIVPSSMSGNGATITVNATGHKLVAGGEVLITGVATTTAYNGLWTVASTPTPNQFTITSTVTGTADVTVAKMYKNYEVMVALGQLEAVRADIAVVPTYTAAATYSGTSHVVTGDIITITLTASEPVEMANAPKVALNFNLTQRLATADASSTATSLVFKYTVVAGDIATAGQMSVGTSTVGGWVSDVLPENKKSKATVSFTAPNVSLWSAN